MATTKDEELIKISRRQLNMLHELVDLQTNSKIDQIPVADSLDIAYKGLAVGEVKVLKTMKIERIF